MCNLPQFSMVSKRTSSTISSRLEIKVKLLRNHLFHDNLKPTCWPRWHALNLRCSCWKGWQMWYAVVQWTHNSVNETNQRKFNCVPVIFKRSFEINMDVRILRQVRQKPALSSRRPAESHPTKIKKSAEGAAARGIVWSKSRWVIKMTAS